MSSVRSSWKYDHNDASGGIVRGDEEKKSLSDSGTKATYQKSNSSSSSTSSEDEFFQLDPSVFGKLFAGVPTTQNSSPLEHKKLLHGDATESTQGGNTGDYTSSLKDETADPDGSNLPGPNHAPSQEAGTRGDYDPNSVPACVFERSKLVAPADWSVGSKDTMLRNRAGSNSLSCSPPEADASVPLVFDSDMRNWDVANDLERSSSNEATHDETVKNVLRAATEEHGDMNMPPAEGTHSDGTSSCSDASSTHSFVFPILTGGSGPLRVVPEQLPRWQKHPQAEEPNAPRRTPRSPQNKWLLCFSCSFCHAGDDH